MRHSQYRTGHLSDFRYRMFGNTSTYFFFGIEHLPENHKTECFEIGYLP